MQCMIRQPRKGEKVVKEEERKRQETGEDQPLVC